jgi:hypothetical protein
VEESPEGELGALLRHVSDEAPEKVDLTDPTQESWVTDVAEKIEAVASSVTDLERIERTLVDRRAPVVVGLAAKLAGSRARVRALSEPIHLSVVLAVYKEHIRILRRAEHAHGEDFLRRKIAQLSWLFRGTPHGWDLTVVDDGCPEGSGQAAEAILRGMNGPEEVRVLYLADAIEEQLPPVRGLSSTDESRKGGSIRYGLWNATRVSRPGHALLYTDADLSTHLGQAGLLLQPLAERSAQAAVGSRREATSVVVKGGTRNTRGKLFIYLWKRMLPTLRDIVDTQCGFKAFTPRALEGWTENAIESGFAFDIELLLHAELSAPGSVSKAPIAWIDSDAESTTAALEPYLDMLQMVARFYRTYLPKNEAGDAFASFVDALDQAAFDRLVEALPDEITQADPATFGDWAGVSPAELAELAGLT